MWFWISIIAGVILAIRVYYHKTSGICYSKRRLDGKIAIVTGSSAGIGKETAKDLANRGARVILACRNVAKAQKVADDIIGTTGNKQVLVRQVDFSKLVSVRKFAKGIIDTESALHILVNNAGTPGRQEKTLTPDGLEFTLVTNHFGHFLLTNMLLNLLKSSAPSRVVNVSSTFHHQLDHLNTDDLTFEKDPYPGAIPMYCLTKLCNILFTVELAEKLRDKGVTANCLHPGFIYTEICWKGDQRLMQYVWATLLKLMAKDENLGSQTTNYLAVSEEVENVSGEYFADCKLAGTSLLAKNRKLAKKLWEASEKAVSLTPEDTHYKPNQE